MNKQLALASYKLRRLQQTGDLHITKSMKNTSTVTKNLSRNRLQWEKHILSGFLAVWLLCVIAPHQPHL
jgi:hypothetical protein